MSTGYRHREVRFRVRIAVLFTIAGLVWAFGVVYLWRYGGPWRWVDLALVACTAVLLARLLGSWRRLRRARRGGAG